jgi:hypothetical protein
MGGVDRVQRRGQVNARHDDEPADPDRQKRAQADGRPIRLPGSAGIGLAGMAARWAILLAYRAASIKNDGTDPGDAL